MQDRIVEHRRRLHAIPEIAFDLPETSAYICSELNKIGLPYEAVAGCGVAAFVDAGRKGTTLFRADMDALPVLEPEGLPFRSTHEGRMHACGHDAHMAILLGLAEKLNGMRREMASNALLVFQPAEETGGGGEKVAQSGVMEKYGVLRAFALHVAPELPIGQIATRPGAFMAKTSEVTIDVYGKSAHVANAAEGIDAIEACAKLLLRLYEMEKALPAGERRLMKFGSFHGGSAPNIVCNECRLFGTMRAFDMDLFGRMKGNMLSIAEALEKETGVRCAVHVAEGYPPVINDEELYQKTRELMEGMDFSEMPEPVVLGEDFSFYGQKVPALMFKLGLGTGIALHSPSFVLDERALEIGVEAFWRLAKGI
jgi:amidohydrolase